MTGALHEGLFTLMILSLSILLRMINIEGRLVQEINTHILYSLIFPRKSCRL